MQHNGHYQTVIILCGVPSRRRRRATLPADAEMPTLLPCQLHRHVASVAIHVPFMSKSGPASSSSAEAAERRWCVVPRLMNELARFTWFSMSSNCSP
ncbi:hypothetical protein L6452_20263 [Arctium lappa]|uniref:Uncharacterized protein n=1 Tax=Arctium lappa TaxID=4217 RepID=A0ACB9BC69_ARCLA|nr:hypothetical protein L6452_20263 [Arctium lappa]